MKVLLPETVALLRLYHEAYLAAALFSNLQHLRRMQQVQQKAVAIRMFF